MQSDFVAGNVQAAPEVHVVGGHHGNLDERADQMFQSCLSAHVAVVEYVESEGDLEERQCVEESLCQFQVKSNLQTYPMMIWQFVQY